jgi:hypothetical protein
MSFTIKIRQGCVQLKTRLSWGSQVNLRVENAWFIGLVGSDQEFSDLKVSRVSTAGGATFSLTFDCVFHLSSQ